MSDIYQRRSNLNTILAITGFVILGVTIVYSNFLAKNLEDYNSKNAEVFLQAIDFIINNSDFNADLSVHDKIIEDFPLPAIVKYESGSLEGNNFDGDQNEDIDFLEQKIVTFLEEGKTPLRGPNTGVEVYFFNSKLLAYIKYYPLVQVFLVGAFIALGYFLFNSSRKAEQNRVWAGMAKETAHQLGTPISAILAWIQHLRENTEASNEQLEVLEELDKDVDRLNLIADRFSKIGSTPDLKTANLLDELNNVRIYMERRSPRKVSFSFPEEGIGFFESKINSHLFVWVVENLIRNSLDSMDGKGEISAQIIQEGNYNVINLSDTGKGIPSSKFKTIFQPGYSTKKRGWGLGLSLAKRIIEEYHNGKIFVKNSRPNEKTTFCIKLPIA